MGKLSHATGTAQRIGNWHIATGTLGTLSPEAVRTDPALAYGGTGVLAAMTATIQNLQTFVYKRFAF